MPGPSGNHGTSRRSSSSPGFARKVLRLLARGGWYFGAVPAWYVFCFPVLAACWTVGKALELLVMVILVWVAASAIGEGWGVIKKMQWSRPAPVVRYETNVIIDRDVLDGGVNVLSVPGSQRGYYRGNYQTGY